VILEARGHLLFFVASFLSVVLRLLRWLSLIHPGSLLTPGPFPPSGAKRPADGMTADFEGLVPTSKRRGGCSDSNADFSGNSG
jgi:hypothetical protein